MGNYVEDSGRWTRTEGISGYVEKTPITGGDRNLFKPFSLSNCGLKKRVFTKNWEGGKMKENTLPAVLEKSALPVTPEEKIKSARDEMEAAAGMAKLLKDLVDQAGLAKKFGGQKEHLEYEAWQTIGKWHRYTAATEWTRPIKEDDKIIGWEARVNIIDENGRIIATAENMCMRDEPNWKTKPNYAIRSMAQTRTAGKAFRSILSHVAVLAGYSPTPAEEMVDSFKGQNGDPRPTAAPQKPPTDDKPTAKQVKMIFGKGEENQLSKEETTRVVEWWRKGDRLTKTEASELIDRMMNDWDGLLDDFMAAQATKEPDDIPI